MAADWTGLHPGVPVRVRGERWTVGTIEEHTGCALVLLHGCGAENAGAARTLLLPFDRLRHDARPPRTRAVSRRQWAHCVAAAVRSSHPFGGLRTAADARVDLLPFQLQPALAALRHAALRLLIADDVGLGKTVQAGLLVSELCAREPGCRVLVVTPAGVRDQWRGELVDRFSLDVIVMDGERMLRRSHDLPGHVNPWSLDGVHLTSIDLVKRPEVLRSLEDVDWDLVVFDEAHALGPGSARLAAARALGARARRTVLLSATPPDGDARHFGALAGIGSLSDGAPLVEFRRTRGDVGLCSRRQSRVLGVRLSAAERSLHRLLARYSSAVWHAASPGGGVNARLAVLTLRKRALSTAHSLARSVRRRLALLDGERADTIAQLCLPLGEEDPLPDHPPDAALAAAGLADPRQERAWLRAIVSAADAAARVESKLRVLARLLRRIDEPVLLFTEYRDTLAQIAAALSSPVAPLELHGGLSLRDRERVVARFTARGGLLLATDAASEGLNLHHRCRVVVHFELPWTPARLEQRTGRLDRLGQTRTVHELLLVARDSAEAFVLAPLIRRVRSAAGRSRQRLMALDESAVAAAVLDGTPVETWGPEPVFESVTHDLGPEATLECERLTACRRLRRTTTPVTDAGLDRMVSVRKPHLTTCLSLVRITLTDDRGRLVHSEVAAVVMPGGPPAAGRRARDAVAWAQRLDALGAEAIIAAARHRTRHAVQDAVVRHRQVITALAAREAALGSDAASTAMQLVQAGLFDRRDIRAAAVRRASVTDAGAERQRRARQLDPDVPLRIELRLVAVLAGWCETT